MATARQQFDSLRVAFGPVLPGWGSWDWVGQDTAQVLSGAFSVRTFTGDEIPDGDVVCVIKHALPAAVWRRMSAGTRIVYAPIDYYGGAAAIDADGAWLRRCDRIVVHCERLRRYFSAYAAVEYLDHHVKYVAPLPPAPRDGPILWVGVRSNLPPLAAWLREHPLPRELVVLTNPEEAAQLLNPENFGFLPRQPVRMEVWSPERQRFWLRRATAAVDVKGDDFRSRHKPPAKALDFLASGLPLAMHADSSSAEHLARMGFELAVPEDPDRWLSRAYWDETQRFGAAVRELLSRERIGIRWRRLIEQVVPPRTFPERLVSISRESVVSA